MPALSASILTTSKSQSSNNKLLYNFIIHLKFLKPMKKIDLFGAYTAPKVRVINARIERGFAISGPSDFIDPDYESRPEE